MRIGSGRNDPVIIVNTVSALPVPRTVARIFRRALDLFDRDHGLIAAEFDVVFQRGPRQRIIVVADPEESAKAEYRVRNPAADLLNHDALDGSDLFAIGAIDRRTLDLVAADKAYRFPLFRDHAVLLDQTNGRNAGAFQRAVLEGLRRLPVRATIRPTRTPTFDIHFEKL